ncbi:MAG: efflux RND transporter periplasmic adaptor subunit [Alphaproteobacteria bacterium]|nr:efflux RND transporter periplasmic adaptor subunit [Alphaproteobacteria bacterium]
MKRAAVFALMLFLAACGQSEDHGWLGYAEGDNALISAPQPGWLAHLHVQRGDDVKPGQLLFRLDDTREQAARDQAAAAIPQIRAQMKQAQANLEYARTTLLRQQGLARAHAGVPSALDQASANYKQAAASLSQLQAQEAQAQAALSGAAYALAQRDIVSTVSGTVQDVYFREGEYVPPSTPVISVLPPKNIYVRFFVPETQFARARLGQTVRISCDGCRPLTARITFIAQQEEFTPPVIFSIGNREKLVFKMEARVAGGLPLHPGQPVEVRPL